MFHINFDNECFKPTASYGSDKQKQTLRFDPPVYEQRYSAVLRFLELKRWSGHLKKVVEFGCAEMNFLILLKRVSGIEHILQKIVISLMMDVSQDRSCLTTNFDMEILMSMTNSDLHIRLIKDQVKEISTLKSQLSSFNTSAMQMKNCYTMEKSKNDGMESENRELQLRIKRLEEEISMLNKKVINDTGVHEQAVANLENQLVDSTLLCKQFIIQGNILQKYHLMNKDFRSHYKNAKEFLTRRGETVEDVKICVRTKKVNAATMTDESSLSPPVALKTFCDKSTMHSPMMSTATRGTSTSTLVKKVDVGTNYPEPVSIEEIFRLMIVDVPPLITPIDLLPAMSVHTQTMPSERNRNMGTMTRIQNVRRKISYAKDSQPQLSLPTTSDSLYHVKKEEDSLTESISNIGCLTENANTLPINRKLTNLWQIVGQMIFSIVGSGQVFDNSSNTNLINQNLIQLRRAIELGQEIDFPDLPANELCTRIRNINDLIHEPDSHSSNDIVQQHLNNTFIENQTVTLMPQKLHCQRSSTNQMDQPIEVTSPTFSMFPVNAQNSHSEVLECSSSNSESGEDFIKKTQFIDDSSKLPIRSEIADHVFKVPTVAVKRRSADKICLRKRPLKTRRIMKSSGVDLTELNSDKSNRKDKVIRQHSPKDRRSVVTKLQAPDDTSLLITSFVSEVSIEEISEYFKMPEFIEPILDFECVMRANEISAVENECENNEKSAPESVILFDEFDSPALPSNDSLPTFRPPVIIPTSPKKSNLTVRKPIVVNFDQHKQTLSQRKHTIINAVEDICLNNEKDNTKTTPESVILCDEFDSPASPSPDDNHPSFRLPLIIPTSPKKSNPSIVKSILANFDQHKRRTVSQRKNNINYSAEEEQILAATRNRIEKYLVSEWTKDSINICCNDVFNVRPAILSKTVIEIVMNTKYENPSKELTPPAPGLPRSHQQIIVLIKRISQHVRGFEEMVLFQLEKTLFVLTGEKRTVNEALNLTHLFIGLIDCTIEQPISSRTMLFVYKCLYYFNFKAIPMVYSVLMAYPTLLPRFQAHEDVTNFVMNNNSNILQATIMIILINTNLYESPDAIRANAGFKKKELSIFLKSYYHFPCIKPTTDDFFNNLVNRLNAKCNNMRNIAYSLILIAKRKGTEWADNVIQSKLLPLLNEYILIIPDGGDNDERITILVSAISSIVKTYPITKDITNYQHIFFNLMDLSSRQAIQETAVMALLQTSRFGLFDVYQRISDWRPSFKVDIDEGALLRNLHKAQPLIADYLRQREKKLKIDVYHGTIEKEHDCLRNTDVVIGIEIIEHLYPETLEKVPYNIFGFMKPKIAIFTTPNSECNVLFDMTDKFRHDDHKFEWTREQFEDWGHNICDIYPDYKVAFYGIGPGPDGTEHLGCCSQMAIFVRDDFLEFTSKSNENNSVFNSEYYSSQDNASIVDDKQGRLILNEVSDDIHYINQTKDQKRLSNVGMDMDNETNKVNPIDDIIIELASAHIDNLDYRLVQSFVYKENRDERSREQKIFDEAFYHIQRYMNLDDDHYDFENDVIRVPVEKIFNLVYKQTEDINEFKHVMRKKEYIIDASDNFLIKPYEQDEEDDDYEESQYVEVRGNVAEDEEEDWD